MRRLAPYLLLGVLVAGTGLGIGLGLAMAPSAFSSRLVLSRTDVVPGQNIEATLVVTNRTGHPIKLGKACNPPILVVALMSPTYTPKIAWAIRTCLPGPLIFPTGVSRRPYSVFTTYAGCAGPGGTPSRSSPRCLPGGGLPPLPSGTYQAVLGSDVPLPLLHPAPVQVTLFWPRS